MSVPQVTPEGTTITLSTRSSEQSLIPDLPRRRLPKGRVFIHRLPPRPMLPTERYAFDDDFPSIAASESTNVCVVHSDVNDSDRTSFRERLRRLSKRGEADSIIEDFRGKKRPVGCADFLINWFARKEKDLDPPIWHDNDDFTMFSIVGYDDFMHGGRRPSAAARMMARIRGGRDDYS